MLTSDSRNTTIFWCAVVATAAALAFVHARQSLRGQDPQAFRVSTHLVQVNVVVHDKNGAPVAGLERRNFTVLDEGKKQEISFFSVTSTRSAPVPVEPLPANVFSNRAARQGAVPHNVAVILLDGMDTKFEDQAQARRHLIKFFTQIQPQDRVAVYTLGTKLCIIQDFTNDPSPLLEALRDYEKHGPAPSTHGVENSVPEYHFENLTGPAALAGKQLDAGLFGAFVGGYHVTKAEYERDILIVLAAFEAIANRLTSLPGHKSIIWLTDQNPMPISFGRGARAAMLSLGPLANQTLRTTEALIRADVAIYPIDAKGLFTDPAYHATEGEARFGARDDGIEKAGKISFRSQLWGLIRSSAGLNYIAQGTGGKAFYNTNDLKGSLRAALDDAEVTYTLGYYPDHAKWDGRYRTIKVAVNQKDVHVRHRAGYFAESQPTFAEKDRIEILKQAALSPLDATGVGLTVKLEPMNAVAGQPVKVNVYVDARTLTFGSEPEAKALALDVWVGQYSKRGESLGGISKTVAANLKPEQYQKIVQAGGLDVTFDGKLESGAAELRVVARDATSGSVGSLRVPVHP